MRKPALALIFLMACSKANYQPVAEIGRYDLAKVERVNAAQPLDVEHNTEEYGTFVENAFLRPADNPLSTFSIDVDRASYANVRRFLRNGVRPPRDAVRIEEMVNYFAYDYPEPSNGDPVSITTELAACPWNENNRLLLVGLQTKKIDTRDLPPNNLVFLVDTS